MPAREAPSDPELRRLAGEIAKVLRPGLARQERRITLREVLKNGSSLSMTRGGDRPWMRNEVVAVSRLLRRFHRSPGSPIELLVERQRMPDESGLYLGTLHVTTPLGRLVRELLEDELG